MASLRDLFRTPALLRAKRLTDAARKWFDDQIDKLSQMKLKFDVGHSYHGAPLPGTLMFFGYGNAKYRKTLPYWDTFPLVLPFNVKGDRFWGLNLHYIHPYARVSLLHELLPTVEDSTLSGQKRMEVSWTILQKYASDALIRPSVHQYLLTGNHVTSGFMLIKSDEWANAALLPRERFVSESQGDGKRIKISTSQVY